MDTSWLGHERAHAFEEADVPFVIIDHNLVMLDLNRAYLEATGRRRDDLVGVRVLDAFPENDETAGAKGAENLTTSIEGVFRAARPHRMALQRWDLRAGSDALAFTRRFWLPVNSPLCDDSGRVVAVLHQAHDVTAVVDAAFAALPAQGPDADLAHAWGALLHAFTDEVEAHEQTRLTAHQLQAALDSRVIIEQAKGVVAARDAVSVAEAFLRIRRHARRHKATIHDVARAVVDLGLVLDRDRTEKGGRSEHQGRTQAG